MWANSLPIRVSSPSRPSASIRSRRRWTRSHAGRHAAHPAGRVRQLLCRPRTRVPSISRKDQQPRPPGPAELRHRLPLRCTHGRALHVYNGTPIDIRTAWPTASGRETPSPHILRSLVHGTVPPAPSIGAPQTTNIREAATRSARSLAANLSFSKARKARPGIMTAPRRKTSSAILSSISTP